MSAPGRPRTVHPLLASARRRLILGLLALAALGAIAIFGPDALLDADSIEIERQRAHRYATAAAGLPLPGTPDLGDLPGRLAAQSLALGAPVFIRIFKREFELELWLKRGERFHLFAIYPICRWSGRLGPKLAEGDSQAPEGFYAVDAKALNPASRWHRSFNLGFPNAFDRARGRTGSLIMVHGGCTSAGCFAMTDAVVDEIWRLVTAALAGGQKRFGVHVFPFRMSRQSLEARQHAAQASFWADLKLGHDAFEAALIPPRVSVCRGRYAITAGPPGSDGSHEIVKSCMSEPPGVE